MNDSDEAPDFAVYPNDLGMDVSSEEVVFMRQLESQWKKFMFENPHLHPRGRRAARLAVLAKQIEDTKMAEEKAGQELAKQLDFFEQSREALEETYASEVEYANKLQKAIHDRLEKQLDDIAMSEHLMKQTLPWDFFLEAADMKAIPHVGSSSGGPPDGGARPSARALALIAPDGDAQDVRLRALRMDHALLTTQMKLVEKESQRIDLNNASLAFVGKFLTEHNVWGILQKQENNQHRQHQENQQQKEQQRQEQQQQGQKLYQEQQLTQQQERQQHQQQERQPRERLKSERLQEQLQDMQQTMKDEDERQPLRRNAVAPLRGPNLPHTHAGKHSVDAPAALGTSASQNTKQDP